MMVRRHRDHVAPIRVAKEEFNEAGKVLPSVPIEMTQLPTPEVTEQDARDTSSEPVTEHMESRVIDCEGTEPRRSTRIRNPPDRFEQTIAS